MHERRFLQKRKTALRKEGCFSGFYCRRQQGSRVPTRSLLREWVGFLFYFTILLGVFFFIMQEISIHRY